MNKNLIIILMTCFLFSGCSLVKTLTAPFKPSVSAVPQETEKSKAKEICKGKATWDERGNIKTCSKGYFAYESTYGQKERKLTLKEKVMQFLDNLMGWSFWIFIGLLMFCPSVLAWLIGRTFNGFRTALTSTVRAISKAKKNGGNFTEELRLEHAKSQEVKKIINEMRAKVD